MTLTDLLVASTPIIVLLLWLAWRGIPTLIAWQRERKYQVEWHREFGREHLWRQREGLQPREDSLATI